MDAIKQEYDENQIKVLKGLEPVRLRPNMYIGETTRAGLHHLIWEIFDNSVDEAMAGHCSKIDIVIGENGEMTVSDNGRGIPVGVNKEEGVSALTLVFTSLHAGGKFANASGETAYKTSGGLHGVGASVTNALSTWLNAKVRRDGSVYEQNFKKGISQGEPVVLRPMTEEEESGTTVSFLPDPTIFKNAREEVGGMSFDFDMIKVRVRQIAYLSKGLLLTITEGDRTEEFYSENGLADMINDNIPEDEEKVVEDVLAGADLKIKDKDSDEMIDVNIDFAMNYLKGHKKTLRTFVNNIHTFDGGTHEIGLVQAMGKIITDYAKTVLKMNKTFKGDDILEGANIVLAIKVSDAEFVGQTKRRLESSVARKATYQFAKELFEDLFEKNPESAKIIVKKAEAAQMAREAAEKSRIKVRRQESGNLIGGGVPGKLADCTSKNPEDSELFIVEGDSAGGSAKQGRDRMTQAILPLKGKILNTHKADNKRMLDSQEVTSLIKTLGTGIGDDFDIAKLKYHKVIIMTDADVDGSHIAVLLLTFFMTQMPQLIREGYIYLAMPPLYKASKKKGKGVGDRYYLDDEELNNDLEVTAGRGTPECKWDIQRFKGLGEMNPEQLAVTTMEIATRLLQQIDMPQEIEEESYEVMDKLMGPNVPPRREFLETNAEYADLDI
jgi:DNA gyrase subunit B